MKDSVGEASNLAAGDACWSAMLTVWYRVSSRPRRHQMWTRLCYGARFAAQVVDGASKQPVPSMADIRQRHGRQQAKAVSQPKVGITCEPGDWGVNRCMMRTSVLLIEWSNG